MYDSSAWTPNSSVFDIFECKHCSIRVHRCLSGDVVQRRKGGPGISVHRCPRVTAKRRRRNLITYSTSQNP